MSVKKDLEFWFYKFSEAVKSDLNVKIEAINTEKAATDVAAISAGGLGLETKIDLDTVPSDQYFWNATSDRIPDSSVSVLFRAAINAGDQAGDGTIVQPSLITSILVSDQMESDTDRLNRRLFRYRRALLRTLNEESLARGCQGFSILNIPDDFLKLENGGFWAVPIAVQFSVALVI